MLLRVWYDLGMTNKLFTLRKDGTPVAAGDTVTDFRGDTHIFARAVRPNETGRDGKVQVEDSPIAYYASVFNLRVTEYEATT